MTLRRKHPGWGVAAVPVKIVLARLGAADEAGLPGLEAVVAELSAKLDKFLHFKESCWRNISV